MEYFDTHAHIFERGLPLAANRRYTPDYDAKIETFLRHLDIHNISKGVLIQPSFLGNDNSYILNAIKRYPNRLYGVAVVNPNISLDRLKEMANMGIIGIRLNLIGLSIPDFSSGNWIEVLNVVKNLKWHIEIQRDAKDLPVVVEPLLRAGVKIVVDHFGKPNSEDPLNDPGFQYLLKTGLTKRLWVKVSGFYRFGNKEQGKLVASKMLPQLLKYFGPKRLLWGSDWPHTMNESTMNYDISWNTFVELIPDVKTRNIILTEAPNDLLTIG